MKNEHNKYCTYEDVHNGCYDCHFCGNGFVCLGNECIYADTLWKIRVRVFKSHLDWDMGKNSVATFDFLSFGDNLPDKAEKAVNRIQKMYSEDIWCDYTLKLVPQGLRLTRVVDNLIFEMAKNWAYDEYDIVMTSVGYQDNGRGFNSEIWNDYLYKARRILFESILTDTILLKEKVDF